MKKATFTAIITITILISFAKADIVSVSGPLSTEDTLPAIIAPPTDVLNDTVTNTGQQGFNEAQGVMTSVAYDIDGGSIPAGTWVNSHMIFLNAPAPGPNIYHNNVEWTFSGPIIGVMSDPAGNFEAASTTELGATGTNYPAAGFANRGIEGGDGYIISGNQLTLTMGVDPDAGDWIRVVTLASPPVTELAVDIKPGSCPNPLNVNSKGVLPVAILGMEDFDVSDVDVGSVRLEGVAPLRFDYEDVATPFEGELCDCHEEGADGFLDLTLKFDTQEIAAALGDVEDGEVLPLFLTSTMIDGTVMEGSDCIRIIKKDKD